MAIYTNVSGVGAQSIIKLLTNSLQILKIWIIDPSSLDILCISQKLQSWWLEKLIDIHACARSVERLPIVFKQNLTDYSLALKEETMYVYIDFYACHKAPRHGKTV